MITDEKALGKTIQNKQNTKVAVSGGNSERLRLGNTVVVFRELGKKYRPISIGRKK